MATLAEVFLVALVGGVLALMRRDPWIAAHAALVSLLCLLDPTLGLLAIAGVAVGALLGLLGSAFTR